MVFVNEIYDNHMVVDTHFHRVYGRSFARVLYGEYAMYRASFKKNSFRGRSPRKICGNPVLYENEHKPRETNESREGVVVR